VKKLLNERARQRLDARLSKLKPVEDFRPPPKGWLRAIRTSLGMSAPQLAKRMKVRAQSLEDIEKSEALGKIQLETLRRVASELDCTLVYALVPNSSLEEMVRSRARKIALRDLSRVSHTMKLEAQETSDADLETRIENYIKNILRERDLWN
jgi:predicted DNA-binding mobile mystery protein A